MNQKRIIEWDNQRRINYCTVCGAVVYSASLHIIFHYGPNALDEQEPIGHISQDGTFTPA